ncbi:MAG: cytochrome P450 [Rhodospirillaceae bacterium]|nr:MAG: cytochrome P450 [Rhodospirillaceae bacterium]
MTSKASGFADVPIPFNVPSELVIDFDYFHPPQIDQGDVYSAWKRLHEGPDIVWTPHNGGHWIFTRAADIKWVQENFQIFSHEEFSIPRVTNKIVMPPLTVDPPLHSRFRAVLNPYFWPSKVHEMAEKARALTIGLIEALKGRESCEFVSEFARVMPVTVFLGIVDLPLDRRQDFVEWASNYIGAADPRVRQIYLKKMSDYLAEVLKERSANPGHDLLSRIAAWRQNARYGGEHEVFGMAMLIFLGGLDTVANILSFTVRHLAQHPEQRRRLIDEPEIIPQAAEELLRRFGLSNTGRLVKEATDYKGVHFAQHDMVMVPISLSSMDDRLYQDPLTVDFGRNAPFHNTFGNGPHKCVGAPLARAELKIFLEEWARRMPEFCIDSNNPPITHSGPVNGVSRLNLLFSAQS